MPSTVHRSAQKVLLAACIFVLAFVLSGCGDQEETHDTNQANGQPVSITIECESNLLLSKYDLDVYVDDEYQGSLDHGTSKTFDIGLSEGDHVLRVSKEGDSGVDGSADFSVSGSESLKYLVRCTHSQVEIEPVENVYPPFSSSDASDTYHDEAYRAFADAGFTNITEEELRDLPLSQRNRNWYTDNIEINGNDSFDTDESFKADDEVVITYHVLADLNPPASSSELEGRDYEDVVDAFEQAGFINVTARETSASGVAGTVSEVCIGGLFGSTDFSMNDIFAFDAGVEVLYCKGEMDNDLPEASQSEPAQESVPDSDVQKLITSTDTNAEWFSSAYRGKTITFDGWVADLQNHDSHDTRWDVLILAGDYGDGRGPNFRLTDVAFSDMHVENADELRNGDNITITATVGDYNSASDWLELDPISISVR